MRTMLLSAMALLAAGAAPASAQLTQQEAIKQLKDASKAQLKAFKQSVAAAVTSLDAELDTVDDLISDSSDAGTVVTQLGLAGIAYMSTLNEEWSAVKGFVEDLALLTLVELADGADLEGAYPKGFAYGDGGTLDKHRAQLVKAGLKSRDKALKRLLLTAKRAEEEANIVAALELRFPTRRDATGIDQDGLVGAAQTATIETLVVGSDLDVTDDGVVIFGGATGAALEDVTVGYSAQGISESDDVPAEDVSGRYSAGFFGLAEGGVVVTVRQGTGGTFHDVGESGLR